MQHTISAAGVKGLQDGRHIVVRSVAEWVAYNVLDRDPVVAYRLRQQHNLLRLHHVTVAGIERCNLRELAPTLELADGYAPLQAPHVRFMELQGEDVPEVLSPALPQSWSDASAAGSDRLFRSMKD